MLSQKRDMEITQEKQYKVYLYLCNIAYLYIRKRERERKTQYVAQINKNRYYFLVVPHITDAIQEWVERVANQSVTEDGAKPEVLLII